MRILIFGDSITQGYFDVQQGGWANRLARQYEKQTLQDLNGEWTEVFNLGISGDVAAGVVKRLARECEARKLATEPVVIVIAIGMNDTLSRGKESVSSPELYKGELEQILAIASQFTEKILFVGLTAVDDEMCDPWKYSSTGKGYNNDRIWEFEQALREFCAANDVDMVKVFEKFQGKRIEENLLADGLHPNEAGHQLIADLVKPKLDKLLDS